MAACLCANGSSVAGHAAEANYPELQAPRLLISDAAGLGEEDGICRRDPSDVIRVGDQFFVWYTKVRRGPDVFQYPSGYSGEIWYATSRDGVHWQEQGKALGTGGPKRFDSGGVFTPNILQVRGRFYLFYTAVRTPIAADHPTAIGVAIAESPRGPWRKSTADPVLMPSKDIEQFDSFRVDDACLILRNGKYWLYYKGRQTGHTPQETKWGVAIAQQPEGPYRKSSANPVVGSGHEVLVWPDRRGVVALVGPTGPEKNTIQYAEDGLHFRVISHVSDPPMAPGAYRPDAFNGARYARGIKWGIAMHDGPNPYLVRFEYETSEETKTKIATP